MSDVTCSDFSEASERLLQLDLALRTLRHAEASYIAQMQEGVEAFTRPLRVCLTSHERSILFQNIEKLVAVSEFVLAQVDDVVTSSNTQAASVSDVCNVYTRNLRMLSTLYGEYVRGLPAAMRMLASLHENNDVVEKLEVSLNSL